MKKFFITLALFLSIFSVTALASEPNVKVSTKVMNAFKTDFSEATDVEWAQVENMFQAKFAMEGQQYAAYYDADGTMLVVARFLMPTKLPNGLRTSLEEIAKDGLIAYVFELTDEDGVHFYATIQKGEKKEMVQSSGNKKWIPYTKVKI